MGREARLHATPEARAERQLRRELALFRSHPGYPLQPERTTYEQWLAARDVPTAPDKPARRTVWT